MEAVPSPFEIHKLLSAMSSPRPFIYLGAGASRPLLPGTSEIRDIVRRDFAALGSWPAPGDRNCALFDTIFHDFVPETSTDWLLFSNRARLALFVQKAITAHLTRRPPAQYAVLKWTSPRAVLFNYNLDSLASYYVGHKRQVLTPHGSIDREWTTAPEIMEYLEWSLETDLRSFRFKVLPGPEQTDVTRQRCFSFARPKLTEATAVIIVGYSFARNRFGKLDDSESFEYLVEAQEKSSCPIYIVNDRPTDLEVRMQSRLKSKRVQLIQLRWDIFSNAILPLLDRCSSLGDLDSQAGILAVGQRYTNLSRIQ